MTTSPTEQRMKGFGLSCFLVIVHAMILSALLIYYVWQVPHAKRMFDEFGLTLPWLTLSIFKISNWISANIAVALLALLTILLVDLGVVFLLGKYKRSAQIAWALVIVAVLLAIGAVTVVCIALSMQKLTQGLSQ